MKIVRLLISATKIKYSWKMTDWDSLPVMVMPGMLKELCQDLPFLF